MTLINNAYNHHSTILSYLPSYWLVASNYTYSDFPLSFVKAGGALAQVARYEEFVPLSSTSDPLFPRPISPYCDMILPSSF